MNFELPTIYPITDSGISGLSHAEQAGRLIAGDARIIQLREKLASPAEFHASACEVIAIARQHDVRVIINDRVDIALTAGADGVHLGQDDMPAIEARKLLGEQAIIGLSTHSIRQALAACELPVDYIALGPIFTTTSKAAADPALGLEAIRQLRRSIGHFPLVAIGGISIDDLAGVFEAGADSAAMIGTLVSASLNIEDQMRLVNTVGER